MKKIKNRPRKILGLILILGLLLYFATLLWFLPVWLKSPINQSLSNQNLQVNYERLWINPLTLNLHIKQVELTNLSQQLILSAEQANIDWQLWPLLNQRIELESIQLKQARINLILDKNNQLISPQLMPPDNASSEWNVELGQIEVVNSQLNLKKLQETIQIGNINVALNLSNLNNHQQSTLISLQTRPDGSMQIFQSDKHNSFNWKVTDWPLHSLAMWLPTEDTDKILTGQFSAEGSIEWSKNQQPVLNISKLNLSINIFMIHPFTLKQATINSQNIQIDFNSQRFNLGRIKSTQGQLIAEIDPLEIADYQNSSIQSRTNWVWQLDNLDINNWQITLNNNRPALELQVTQLLMSAEDNQHTLELDIHIQKPFSTPVYVRSEGYMNPLRLRGEINAEHINLKHLNPWIAEFNTWQIEQGQLTAGSQFCVQDGVFNATGNWHIPEWVISDNKQKIEAKEVTLKSIGINADQRLIIFNDLTTSVLEVSQYKTEQVKTPADNIVNPPQNAPDNNQWRVLINQTETKTCAF